jgi:hypothetical protein
MVNGEDQQGPLIVRKVENQEEPEVSQFTIHHIHILSSNQKKLSK